MRHPARFLLLAAALCCTAAHRPGSIEQTIGIHAGSGQVITLPAPAASVFSVDPKVVEVRPASPTSLFIFGLAPGHSTVAAMSRAGKLITQVDVNVLPQTFSATLAGSDANAAVPDGHVAATPRENGVTLQGAVNSPEDAQRAESAARAALKPDEKVVDDLKLRNSIQVNLRVRILEMDRSITRDLGVNWSVLANVGAEYTTGFATALPLLNAATSVLGASQITRSAHHFVDINEIVDAMAQDQLVRVLAEPNLTAMSGQTASFLVGGEFPIPVAQFGDTISIDFKQYGVSLAFVPTVLDSGRINLRVRPEVSQLTNQGAIQLQTGTNSSIQIPALQVRRAETSVELGSGQSFAIAGLLQDSTTLMGNNVPGIGDLPILGALFRSDNFQRNQTELVIIVTPYIVRPADNPAAFVGPDQGWHSPNDLERILMLRQGVSSNGTDPAQHPVVPGQAGFMVL